MKYVTYISNDGDADVPVIVKVYQRFLRHEGKGVITLGIYDETTLTFIHQEISRVP